MKFLNKSLALKLFPALLIILITFGIKFGENIFTDPYPQRAAINNNRLYMERKIGPLLDAFLDAMQEDNLSARQRAIRVAGQIDEKTAAKLHSYIMSDTIPGEKIFTGILLERREPGKVGKLCDMLQQYGAMQDSSVHIMYLNTARMLRDSSGVFN